MNDQDRFTDLLSDYLDHDLPRGEAEALERHLAECAECRDTLAALERVKALAAAAFVAVALALSWAMQSRMTPALRQVADAPQTAPSTGPTGGTDAQLAQFDATAIESEIGQLQQALDRGRDKLDPKTVQVLEENLRIIRKATEDARRALEQDPANRDLRQYFASSVTSKLDLVKRSVALAGV